MTARLITRGAMFVAIATIYSWGCSSRSPEAIGQSTSALSAGTNNFLSGSSLYGAHEVALAAGGKIDRPLWAAVFDPHDCKGAPVQGFCFDWAYSSDGQTWTAQPLILQSQISPPPPELMSDQGTFAGWSGDPSLAAIHGPLGNSGRRMVVTNLANSSVNDHRTEDVVIAVSNDDGASWTNPHIVTALAGSGGGVDQPYVAAHTNDRYSVYVGWTNISNLFFSPGFISKVSYDLSYNFTASPAIPIPIPQPGNTVAHIALDIGDVTNCGGQTHEAVFVVWADAGGACMGLTRLARASRSSTPKPASSVRKPTSCLAA